MNIVDAEANLKKITAKFSKDTFIFDLMMAYDFPKATISRLQKGTLNKAKIENEVVLKKKLYFKTTTKKELDSVFNNAIKDSTILKQDPRFIIVTDYITIKAYDTKVGEKLDTDIKALSNHPDFFLPWAGIEKKIFQGENPADVKAAEKLAKVFDLIRLDNIKFEEKNRHALNVFLTRVLFCFFAEDTDIFPKNLFTESIASHTRADGGDLADYLTKLFEILNKKSRAGLPEYLKEFPYVNGGLFAEEYPVPTFSKRSRESLIDLGSDLNWAEINPDIFGSMIQSVVHPDQRAGLGMHYTSVTNIMKAIEPLFLSALYEEFEKSKASKPKLKKLLERINEIKIFDPACGSGNFLIIAYKNIRSLEMKILKVLGEIPMSGISLSNFFGIEIDDFAHEVAKLSLWLAEHQMDVLFNKEFGNVKASLPLKESGKIICGNAVDVDWNNVLMTADPMSEIYIIGNPPYLGSSMQNDSQKKDLKKVCGNFENYKNLDYISIWFAKASEFIKGKNSKFAFVSTNSLSQGEQVSLLWPNILGGLEIFFAHQSFKWTNNAKSKAAVICVIVGIRNEAKGSKFLFSDNKSKEVEKINPYLVEADTVYIERRTKSISGLNLMVKGNQPTDGGHLILSPDEKDKMLADHPNSKVFLKKLVGSQELIKGIQRWCLWIEDKDLKLANSIPEIKRRIEAVKKIRLASDTLTTKNAASSSHSFIQIQDYGKEALVIPKVSSERRDYLPIGFVDKETVVTDLAFAIYNPEPYLFSIISSRMHMVWVRTTAGRLKSDYRYSNALTYNSFPVPYLNINEKDQLAKLAYEVLSEREKHQEKFLSDLYDPKEMPVGLRGIHKKIDDLVDSLYKKTPFISDEERLECLFNLYLKTVGEKS